MTQRKIIPPELLADLRRDYEQTDIPVDDLAARAGMSKQSFYNWVRTYKWMKRVHVVGRRAAPRHEGLEFWGEKAVRDAAAGPPLVEVARVEVQEVATETPEPAAATSAVVVPPGPAHKIDLAARIQRSVERELDGVERVLGLLKPQDGNEAERAARTLASLARTLREIVSLDDKPSAEPEDDDDAGPRDMDEFRRDLARRIDAIIAEREGPISREPDG